MTWQHHFWFSRDEDGYVVMRCKNFSDDSWGLPSRLLRKHVDKQHMTDYVEGSQRKKIKLGGWNSREEDFEDPVEVLRDLKKQMEFGRAFLKTPEESAAFENFIEEQEAIGNEVNDDRRPFVEDFKLPDWVTPSRRPQEPQPPVVPEDIHPRAFEVLNHVRRDVYTGARMTTQAREARAGDWSDVLVSVASFFWGFICLALQGPK